MAYMLIFFLIISYFTAIQIAAQEEACHPTHVIDLEVTDDLILTWKRDPNDNCTVSYYAVSILSIFVETLYKIEDTFMDVNFLPKCWPARFRVTPVSLGGTEGNVSLLYLEMPAPPDANFTIEYIRVAQRGEGLLLAWDLEEEWRQCTDRFRVVVYNEDYDDAVDIYVDAKFVLLELINPCEEYTFAVRAVHNLTKEGPIFLMRYLTPSRRMTQPALQSLIIGTTSIDLEWQLETYEHNRCEVSSIIIDSPPYFSVAYPVHDNPERPIISTRVTGLLADTMYFLNVTVINTAGPSVPFLTTVQTLPEN